jgi:hypothetical protein
MPDRAGFELSTVLDIARSPEEVFAFLVDIESFKTLDVALVDVTPQGKLAAGLTGTFTHRRGGMTARTTWRVTEFEPPVRLEVAISRRRLRDDGARDPGVVRERHARDVP